MRGAVEAAVGADEGAVADGDGAGVDEGAVEVDVDVCAESVGLDGIRVSSWSKGGMGGGTHLMLYP